MLKKLATLGVLLVAGLHIVFMVIELTFWDTNSAVVSLISAPRRHERRQTLG